MDWVTTVDDVIDTRHLVARTFRRNAGLMGAAIGIAGAALVGLGDPGLGVWLLLCSVPILAAVGFRPLERALVRRRPTLIVGRPCGAVASEGGLAFRQAGVTGTLEWSAATGVVEDARSIVIVTGQTARFGIPKRAFASPDQAAAFADVVRQRIAESRAARSA